MLITEWDWDKYVEVQRREAVEEGIMKGREEGREKRSEEIAYSALLKGLPPEMVSEITGLDPDTIQRLVNQ
jgi:predicted transposase/invertase (TIGR01784 family)